MLKANRHVLLLFITVSTIVAPLSADPTLELESPDFSESGFSEKRLHQVTRHIDQRVADDLEAGLQLLIARKGEIFVLHNAGLLHGDMPVADDSIFFTHSMMKPLTSLVVMQLVEEGRILLSDPVSNFIPEFKNQRIYVSGEGDTMVTKPASRAMTVLHLLTHTAGYTYDYELRFPAVTSWFRENTDYSDSLANVVHDMSQGPLVHEPGTEWQYGQNTIVLARLIEVITGESFRSNIETRVLTPLAMVDSGFVVHKDDLSRLASRYIRNANGKLEESDFERSKNTVGPGYLLGDSGLYTTSADYFRFCQMILNRGELDGVRVAAPRTIDLMTTNMVPWSYPKPIMPPGKGFTPGFSVYAGHEETQSMVSRGSVNWGAASGSIFWIDFAEELIVIMMTQSYPPNAPRSQTRLESLVYQALLN